MIDMSSTLNNGSNKKLVSQSFISCFNSKFDFCVNSLDHTQSPDFLVDVNKISFVCAKLFTETDTKR